MELAVQKREKFGKIVKNLRKDGFIPAEFYGHGIQNEHLTVPAKDFAKVFKSAGENTIINILINGQSKPVLIYDVQTNPLSGEFASVDFYAVKMDEKIQTEVPFVFTGEAPAIKAFNAILVKVMQEIEVLALPANLPKQIEISLNGLDAIGKSIYARDLKIIEGVKLLADSAAVIATIKEQAKEEEKQAETAPAAAQTQVEPAASGTTVKTATAQTISKEQK
ncbi:MAG: 50S ribosomal protein L25 [Candidatus Brennerbacteria bacterium]|nr:50S ribosomal protein L25 [Candidatus Brennerbacteria bacterium]